ncbi:hypothetical protein BH10PLA2_BH10PLA2_39670 [soil metagenome]
MHSSWLSTLPIIELSLSILLWLLPKSRFEWLGFWKCLRTQPLDSWVFWLKLRAAEAYCRITLPIILPIKGIRIWLKLIGQARSFVRIYVTEYREAKFFGEYMLGNGPLDDLTLTRGQTLIGLAAASRLGPCIVRIKLKGTFDLIALTRWLDGETNRALDEAKVLQISYLPLFAGAVQFKEPPSPTIDQ